MSIVYYALYSRRVAQTLVGTVEPVGAASIRSTVPAGLDTLAKFATVLLF